DLHGLAVAVGEPAEDAHIRIPYGRAGQVVVLALALLLPRQGVLVPWQSLGGVRLGMTPAQVRRQWGTRFGRCGTCQQKTWFFNYSPFQPEGAAVRFANGRVDAVWTLWKPPGWRLGGVQLGAPAASLTGRWSALEPVHCDNYEARIARRRGVTTVLYVYAEQLWGFGLSRAGASPCH